ncbi:MAG: hypothetical protein WC789_04005 [Lentisphaeria bacterium]|jgi:hypothetical protein
MKFEHLEGRKFCVVFLKVLDAARDRVQLQCLRGRASVSGGRVEVVRPDGRGFCIPGTALPRIQPSDGTALLQDAEYFVIVKVDPEIQLGGFDPEAVVEEEAAAGSGP